MQRQKEEHDSENLPRFEWLQHYKQTDLTGDLSAGLVVAIMLVPQGMAYAMLAGLPPVIGLYASTVPLMVYALFGSSRQLAVGPVAMISLLVFAGISDLAEPASEQYLGFVFLLALIVGVIQFAMGFSCGSFNQFPVPCSDQRVHLSCCHHHRLEPIESAPRN